MESKFQKHYNYLIFGIILLIFCLSFFQMNSQHWSSHFDSDWFNIYNILLIKSGYVQDFYDHPAFTIFFINSVFLQFYELLDSSIKFDIHEIQNIKNLDEYFKKIFYIARLTNAIFQCASVYLLHLILIKFNVNKIINILLISCFVFSNFFFINLFQIRPEVISVFFILVSFYLVIRFDENKNFYFIFFSGFAVGLAFISKIQIIFFIFFIVMIIPTIKYFNNNNYNTGKINLNYFYFKFLLGLYFLISLIYILLEIIVIYNHERYIGHAKIDLYVFILFNFLYLIYLKFFLKNSDNELKFNINSYIVFFLGFISTIIFLILVDFINLTPVNHNIYFKFLNPYYFLSNRSIDGDFLNVLFNFFKPEIIVNNKYLLISLILIFPFLGKIFKAKFSNIFLAFGLLLLTIFSNNLRYFPLYEIYTFISFFIFIIFLNKEKFYILRVTLLSILLILTIHNSFYTNKFYNYFNRTSYFENCDSANWILLKNNNGLKEWLPWTKKFDENFYKKICSDVLRNNY